MANKVITVTDQSIVTNDTLDSYNNYSSIDGPLGSMTVAESTTGKTVTLTDGVVHEVTTKPVGTTNGEFSAVVSNAVAVDLSGGGGAFVDITPNFDSAGNWTTAGTTYINNATTTPAYLSSVEGFAGDFRFEFDFARQANTGWGIHSAADPTLAFGDWDNFCFLNSSANFTINDTTTLSDLGDVVIQPQPGWLWAFERLAGNLKCHYYNGSVWAEVHDFGAVAGTIYPHFMTRSTLDANDAIIDPVYSGTPA